MTTPELTRRHLLLGGFALSAGLASMAGPDAARGNVASSTPPTAAPAPPPWTPVAPPSAPPATNNGSILGHALGPPLGDGSTSVPRPQPNQPQIEILEPGQKPPQFVVFSWDGASASPPDQLARFRRVAAELDASMTFFLTGLYLVPESKREIYHPPGRHAGASAIPFMRRSTVRRTIKEIGEAWVEGHEIGTHFNGHFCGAHGAAQWSPRQWRTEIGQVEKFVTSWRTITGFDDLPPFPFDFSEIVGARTPCLEGRANLLKAVAGLGWRYDSSGTRVATWPRRDRHGIWNLSMHAVPYGHHRRPVLPMDYNFLVSQPGASTKANRKRWRVAVERVLFRGLTRNRRSNRAPLIIGNHFAGWRQGLYLDAVENSMRRMADTRGVRLVSFRQLVAWMEAQDPKVLAALQRLPAAG